MEWISENFRKRINIYITKGEYADLVYLKGKFGEESINGTVLTMIALYTSHYKKKDAESASVKAEVKES